MNEIHNLNKDILFIHIPKTGGTSVKHLIKDNIPRKFPFGHDPLFSFKQDEVKDKFKFSIIRNPYTRTYSYYRHFCKENNLKVTFEYFLSEIKESIPYKNTPMYYFPQSFYLIDNLGNYSIDKIYKYEKFDEFQKDFKITLPRLNCGNYKKYNFDNDYTLRCIDMVKKIFFIDFVMGDYSFNFDLCYE